MQSFDYSYPTRVHFGEGALERTLPNELAGFGDDTVMIAFGGGSAQRAGILDRVKSLLAAAGKNVVEFGGIMPNPTYAKVQEGAELARAKNVSAILAVGGGSVIDCCKVIAVQAVTEDDIWELEFKRVVLPSASLPLGAVVTASGTGAEMNAGAVITNEELGVKTGVFGVAPDFAVLDPALTLTVPRMQVISGAFDTLSHAMETYLGASDLDNPSDEIALAVMRSTVINMRRLLSNINDMDARGNLMWTSAMAENGILKLGRATDFQAHQIEHQLGAFTDCNHGQGLAVIHPAYYRRVALADPAKLAWFGREVFGVWCADDAEAALAAVEALALFIAECGLPTRLRDLRSRIEITPELLRQVAETTNLIKTGPVQLTRDDVYELLIECL